MSSYTCYLCPRSVHQQEEYRNRWAKQYVDYLRKKASKSTFRSIGMAVDDRVRQFGDYILTGSLSDEINAGFNSILGADYDTELAVERAYKRKAHEGDKNPLLRTPFGDIYLSGLFKTGGALAGGFAAPMANVFKGGSAAGNIGNAGATGALYSGVHSFGEGKGALDRLNRAEQGFALGGLLGLGIGGATEGAKGLLSLRAARKAKKSERLRDLQAFDELSIQPFGPALGDAARVARTIESIPFVGKTVKNPKAAVGEAVEVAQHNVVNKLGSNLTDEGAGNTLQSGLERARTAGLDDLEPSILRNLNISANKTLSNQKNLNAVELERLSSLNTAKMTDSELKLAMSARVDLPSSLRRRVEDLSDSELNRVLSTPANRTSFKVRSQALYEKAERSLPDLKTVAGGALNSLFATRNAKAVLKAIESQQRSSGLIKDGQSPLFARSKFRALYERITNPKANMTIDGIRAARTEVGRALKNFGVTDASLDKTQLSQLYAALTQDLRSAYVGVTARARKNSKLDPKDKNYIDPKIADQADRTLYNFTLADRYYRAGIARMDKVIEVTGAKSAEGAAKKVGRYIRENTSNLSVVRAVRDILRPEEWRSMVGHIVGNLGRGRAGAKHSESGFNWNAWATDWNAISPQAKSIMFKGMDKELVREIDNLARVVNRMKYYESTQNFSGTAAAGGLMAWYYGLINPTSTPQAVMSAVGAAGIGKFLTSKTYVKWLRRGLEIAAKKDPKAMSSHMLLLKHLLNKEPDGDLVNIMSVIISSHEKSKPDTKLKK